MSGDRGGRGFCRWRALGRCLVPPLAVALVTAAVGVPSGSAAGRSGNTFLVRDVRIFDGFRVTGTGSVLVIGGRIAGAGRISAPRRVPVHDGRGKTLLPGLIDAHSHPSVGGNADGDRRDALRFGVTTELDMWGDPALIAEARRQRRSWARTDRSDLWSAGSGITVPGGLSTELPGLPKYPLLAPDADPDRFVADRIREGSDYVKLLVDDGSTFGLQVPTLSPRQIRMIVTAAHRRGRMALAHVTELDHAKTVVRAGADGLVHVFLDVPADAAFVRAIRRSGAFVTPTLVVFDCGLGSEELLHDQRVLPYLSAAQLQILRTRWPGCPASWHRVGLQSVRRLHAAGVPINVGTDAGAVFAAHGVSLLAELAHLTHAGLTPAQTLSAATAVSAHRYRLADRGRIAPGLRADLLLVNGDPSKDITTVRDIAKIWKNGYPIAREAPLS